MKPFEVYKSGGTSTASAEQYRLLENLVRERMREGIKAIIVVSAPDLGGDKNQNRVTQLLKRLEQRESVEERIIEIYQGIAQPLGIQFNEQQFKEDVNRAQKHDEFLYLGEHYNAWMLNRYFVQRGISSVWINAADVISTRGEYPTTKIEQVLTQPFLNENDDVCVMGGFYGQNSSGKVTILPNGGSDLTADYIAAALGAKQNVNLKEVEGIFPVDPRIVKDQKIIEEMTYREVRELAYAGNQVLQEEAMAQCRKRGIPMRVRSLAFPESQGTKIFLKRDETEKPIVGVAAKKDFALYSFIREKRDRYFIDLLDAFSRRRVSVDMIGTEDGLVSIVVENKNTQGKEDMLEGLLSSAFQLENSRKNVALISIVGEGIVDPLAQSERILNVLDNSVITSYGPILGGVATGTTIYHIEKFGMNNETGFAMQLCTSFSEAGVPVTGMSTTIDSISVGTNMQASKSEIQEMCGYLRERMHPDSISVTRNGLLLDGPRLGMSNITIAVPEDTVELAVRKLYLEYFSQ